MFYYKKIMKTVNSRKKPCNKLRKGKQRNYNRKYITNFSYSVIN